MPSDQLETSDCAKFVLLAPNQMSKNLESGVWSGWLRLQSLNRECVFLRSSSLVLDVEVTFHADFGTDHLIKLSSLIVFRAHPVQPPEVHMANDSFRANSKLFGPKERLSVHL